MQILCFFAESSHKHGLFPHFVENSVENVKICLFSFLSLINPIICLFTFCFPYAILCVFGRKNTKQKNY